MELNLNLFSDKVFNIHTIYGHKLYAATVFSLQSVFTMFIVTLCIFLSLFCRKFYVFILLNMVHIELQCFVRPR